MSDTSRRNLFVLLSLLICLGWIGWLFEQQRLGIESRQAREVAEVSLQAIAHVAERESEAKIHLKAESGSGEAPSPLANQHGAVADVQMVAVPVPTPSPVLNHSLNAVSSKALAAKLFNTCPGAPNREGLIATEVPSVAAETRGEIGLEAAELDFLPPIVRQLSSDEEEVIEAGQDEAVATVGHPSSKQVKVRLSLDAPPALPAELFLAPVEVQQVQPVEIAKGEGQAAPNVRFASALEEEADAETKPTEDAIENLDPQQQQLQAKIQKALDIYRDRMLNTRDHGPWEMMHSLIAYGVEKDIRIGHPGGKRVNAIGWLCWNRPCRGDRMFYETPDGFGAHKGPGLQGHHGQFLSMLAQSRVTQDYPMKIGGKDYTIADLVNYEKRTCRAGTELTFKLIGIAHYNDSTDDTWKNDRGETWDVERLIEEELKQPVIGAACGGTHRLFGINYAVHQRLKEDKPVTGQYKRAQIFINDYHRYTLSLQNSDGSFSTSFFSGRGNLYDTNRRLLTTGHIFEFLAFSLPQETLHGEKMTKAANYLAGILIEGQHRKWKVGPLGHALHGLNIYRERILDAKPATEPAIENVVSKPEERVAERVELPETRSSDSADEDGRDTAPEKTVIR